MLSGGWAFQKGQGLFVQLSAQLFADIVGDEAVAMASSATADERRQSPRANLGRRARIYPLIETSSDHGEPVLVRDISVHGIGMLIGEALTPGDEFIIHLPTNTASSLEEPVKIQCAVRRCQAGGSGQTQFLVGSTFELVLNRPLDYAVEFPKEAAGDPQLDAPENSANHLMADQWDTLTASPAEGRFDDQLAEAMSNRPQRRSLGEWLDQFRMTRWLGARLHPWLVPMIDLMHRLGIRSRLTRSSEALDEARIEGADHTLVNDDAAAEAAVPFRERRLITALDSASLYNANDEGISETPASSYTSAASSSRRSSLFVHEAPATAALPVSAPAESIIEPTAIAPPAVTEPASDAPPVVIPAFELPAVLPLEMATPVQTSETPAVEPARAASNVDALIGQLLEPAPSAPREAQTKHHQGAAWRARHRPGWKESARNRPRLGR